MALVACVAAGGAARAAAQEPATESRHVRPEPAIRTLVDEAARRSPVIRQSIEELETLDVTVYIRPRVFVQIDLDGRIALLSIADGHRFLVIELACGRAEVTQMATLGHELFHALEIAREPSVVSSRTLAAFYERIGIKTSDSAGRQTFETEAAARAGAQARRELLDITTRHRNGT